MKYTIFGLCQRTLCELGINTEDALIYRYILDFLPHMKAITVDDRIYYWVNYDYFIKNLPILNAGKKSESDREKKKRISKPIDNLFEAGVLIKYVKRVTSGTYIYVSIDQDIHKRLTGYKTPGNVQEPNNDGITQKKVVTTTPPLSQDSKNGFGATTQKRVLEYKDDSSINNSSISLSNSISEPNENINPVRQDDYFSKPFLKRYQDKGFLPEAIAEAQKICKAQKLENPSAIGAYFDKVVREKNQLQLEKKAIKANQDSLLARKQEDDINKHKKYVESQKLEAIRHDDNMQKIKKNQRFMDAIEKKDGQLYEDIFKNVSSFTKQRLYKKDIEESQQRGWLPHLYNSYQKVLSE